MSHKQFCTDKTSKYWNARKKSKHIAPKVITQEHFFASDFPIRCIVTHFSLSLGRKSFPGLLKEAKNTSSHPIKWRCSYRDQWGHSQNFILKTVWGKQQPVWSLPFLSSPLILRVSASFSQQQNDFSLLRALAINSRPSSCFDAVPPLDEDLTSNPALFFSVGGISLKTIHINSAQKRFCYFLQGDPLIDSIFFCAIWAIQAYFVD